MLKKLTYASLIASFVLSAALPVIAETNGTPPTTTQTITAPSLDLACVQTAVGKRDAAIIAAWDAYTTAVKAALQARSTALQAAWGITNRADRRKAIRAAWKDYQTALKTARKALKDARHAAWAQFNTDRKSCGKGAASDDSGSEGQDSQL